MSRTLQTCLFVHVLHVALSLMPANSLIAFMLLTISRCSYVSLVAFISPLSVYEGSIGHSNLARFFNSYLGSLWSRIWWLFEGRYCFARRV